MAIRGQSDMEFLREETRGGRVGATRDRSLVGTPMRGLRGSVDNWAGQVRNQARPMYGWAGRVTPGSGVPWGFLAGGPGDGLAGGRDDAAGPR